MDTGAECEPSALTLAFLPPTHAPPSSAAEAHDVGPTPTLLPMAFRYLVAALVLISAPLPAQSALTVRHADGTEVTLSDAQLRALPRVTGSATAHGKRFTYEGADLRDVLRAGGVTPVDSLRGPQLRRVILFVGADGYGAVIALSDLDGSIGGRRVVLVDREDGAPVTAARGPRRVIVEGDGRPSRWVQQLVRIELVDVR